MTSFESGRFQWRETYFVLFDSARRPSLAEVEATLRGLGKRYQLRDAQADEEGQFESVTVLAPDDFAALDVSYLSGDEVLEQGAALVEEMAPADAADKAKLARLPQCDARFDIMHFEQMVADDDGDEPEEMLDPSALLIVLDALVELTGGVGIDPQSGSVM